MIDIFFIIIIALLLGLIAWDRHESKLERSKMMNMIISRNATELRDLQAIEKIEVKANVPMQQTPDEVPVESMSDEEFDKKIKEVVANG